MTSNFACNTLLNDFCKNKLKHDDEFSIPPMTVFEDGKHISTIENNKSMGLDGINPFLLKLAVPYVVLSITHVYNFSIASNIFPKVLKNAKVIPLPKSKELNDPNNFRPISILPLLSKPLERHIREDLLNFLNERSLLSQSQSGFRPKLSCHTASATYIC